MIRRPVSPESAVWAAPPVSMVCPSRVQATVSSRRRCGTHTGGYIIYLINTYIIQVIEDDGFAHIWLGVFVCEVVRDMRFLGLVRWLRTLPSVFHNLAHLTALPLRVEKW